MGHTSRLVARRLRRNSRSKEHPARLGGVEPQGVKTVAEQGFYRTWKARVRAIPGLQQYRKVGIGMSYPIFAHTNDGLHVRHFYHIAERTGPDTIQIGPARVLVTLAYETFAVVDENSEPFDLPLFEVVEYTLSADERDARRDDVRVLETFYDRLLEPYPGAPGKVLVDEFAATLFRVVPPVLWPYYELLTDLPKHTE